MHFVCLLFYLAIPASEDLLSQLAGKVLTTLNKDQEDKAEETMMDIQLSGGGNHPDVVLNNDGFGQCGIRCRSHLQYWNTPYFTSTEAQNALLLCVFIETITIFRLLAMLN